MKVVYHLAPICSHPVTELEVGILAKRRPRTMYYWVVCPACNAELRQPFDATVIDIVEVTNP